MKSTTATDDLGSCTRPFESSKSSRLHRRDRIDPDDTITGTDRGPADS